MNVSLTLAGQQLIFKHGLTLRNLKLISVNDYMVLLLSLLTQNLV